MKTYSIIALIVVIAAIAVYSLTSISREDVSEQTVVAPAVVEENKDAFIEGVFEGSLYDLSKKDGAYECSLATTTQGITTNGVIFIAGKNIRGDFETMAPVVGRVVTSMIADGQSVYTWNSLTSEGMKASQSSPQENVDTQAEADTALSGQGFDFNHEYAYQCQKWVADTSQFVIPSSIVFKEI